MKPEYLKRLDTLKNALVSIQETEDQLAGFNQGNAIAARGLLLMARRALAEHLAGELQRGGQ
ncbi:hypothetical protein [Methylohalobius crimeensis]|uniref:hypothetical protein n=1 Tax=Methylohalobius crimeensis TaxID=244365 RepID=UPI0003B44DA6|nr:hypothetical protein [Methylohalobius crimeensis]